MSLKFLTPVDLAKNEIQNAVIQVLGAAPSSPVEGQTYYNSTSHHAFVYNGSAFEQASGASGSGTVTSVALTVPSGFSVSGSPVATAGTLAVTTTLSGVLHGDGAGAIAAATGAQVGAAVRLDQISAPTASVSLNSQKITSLLDPAAAQDAATKNYVDITVQGLQIKPTATVATAAALAANTYANAAAGVGATITFNATGVQTVDGHQLALADLVLVKDESTGSHNGLYTVTTAPAVGVAGVLTRHVDMDATGDFVGGFIPVQQGTANAGSLWLVSNTAAPTVGTTAITFVELNKAADLQAGTGISISGNTVSVAASYAGGGSIATVGTITAGTWTGTTIAVANGGTGATAAAGARTNLGATGKYSALIGDGSSASIAITQATHGLASDAQMHAALYDASTGAQVFADTSINNSNGTVTFTFTTAPASNAYRAVLIG